jgi:hypothetical protein
MSRSRLAGSLVIALAGLSLFVATGRLQARPVDQPHMKAALEALQSAQAHLQEATETKGGHRARAIQLVKQAIAEVQAGIEYDRTH